MTPSNTDTELARILTAVKNGDSVDGAMVFLKAEIARRDTEKRDNLLKVVGEDIPMGDDHAQNQLNVIRNHERQMTRQAIQTIYGGEK